MQAFISANSHTKDPKSPAERPVNVKSRTSEKPSALQAVLSISSVTPIVKPMIIPPSADAATPNGDMPPLVPGGTRENVVIRMGEDLERMPISEARVSPRQQAKCLLPTQRLCTAI